MRKATAVLMIAALMIICLFPVWGRILPGSGKKVEGENRELSGFPDAQTKAAEWPAAIEDWFEDRLAFRREAISFAERFQSADSVQAVEGKEGWMFYLGDGSGEELLGHADLDNSDLKAIREAQQRTAEILKGNRTAYVVMICPDKQTVYPEFLPDALQRSRKKNLLDSIVSELEGIPGICTADTRDALNSAKGRLPLYYLTDSHWNSLGAWTACQSAYKKIGEALPGFRGAGEEQAEIGEMRPTAQGDLAQMLRMNDRTDYAVDVKLKGTEYITETIANPENPERDTMIWINTAYPEGPRAVVFQDSFGEALRPYLAAGFSRTVFVWKDCVDMEIVRKEEAEVVILEVVERLCDEALKKGIK